MWILTSVDSVIAPCYMLIAVKCCFCLGLVCLFFPPRWSRIFCLFAFVCFDIVTMSWKSGEKTPVKFEIFFFSHLNTLLSNFYQVPIETDRLQNDINLFPSPISQLLSNLSVCCIIAMTPFFFFPFSVRSLIWKS